ncbi:MAG: SagB/ThcOx family dehydrogenase [Proteobacteria bacterium]|nr:SagB/ThcOx family dehydrogenase [Pseudomonadota bacterium]
MKHFVLTILAIISLFLSCGSKDPDSEDSNNSNEETKTEQEEPVPFDLPLPRLSSEISLEETLSRRHSVRSYTKKQLTMEEISQLLWAAQGITHNDDNRTSPSAGALYPMEIYVATTEHLYHYLPDGHRAETLADDNMCQALSTTAQRFMGDAPIIIVITGVVSRTAGKYGDRAERYVKLEAGHVAQNILLQAVALDLGGVSVGAFQDEEVTKVLNLPAEHEPLYLIPVGYPAD